MSTSPALTTPWTAAALTAVSEALVKAKTRTAATARAAASRPRGADARRARATRRAQGAYFTPEPLVDLVVRHTLGARLADPSLPWRDDGTPVLRVLDPCAGDGRFLAAAADYLAAHAVQRLRAHAPVPVPVPVHDVRLAEIREAVVRQCLVGIERDPEFAALASARLGMAVHCREALLDAPADACAVDVVLGNPPYVRSVHMARADPELWSALRGRYAASSHGEWDLYAAFIEQALLWLTAGGEAGLVVPSRWLTAAFAKKLRQTLAAAAAVRAIVDFGAAQLFPGATTYTSVVLLSRRPQAQVAVARLGPVGWQLGEIAASSLTGAPWRLAVGAQRALGHRLSQAGPALGSVADIVKGAGTNADSVYVLTEVEERDGLVSGMSTALGERVVIEAAACRVCLRGRDVRAFGQASGAVRCLVPYEEGGMLWQPEALARMPRTGDYLARCRSVLEDRERGRYRDERYYRFGRPQNLAIFGQRRPKLVIPDVARQSRALLDASGALVLDSAYAILAREASGYSPAVLLAVFNSPVVAWWLRHTGLLLRGGYVRLKTAYLASLPLPPLSPALAEVAERAGHIAGTREATEVPGTELAALTDALRRAYGLSAAEWSELVSEPIIAR